MICYESGVLAFYSGFNYGGFKTKLACLFGILFVVLMLSL